MSKYPSQSRATVNFPALVLSSNYKGEAVKQLNQGLAELIKEIEAANRVENPPGQSSTQGGYHTDPDFLNRSDPLIAEFKNEILIPGILEYMPQYYALMSVPVTELTPNELEIRGWANIMRSGEWNKPHNHITTHNRLSSVYYIQVPDRPYPEGILQFDNQNHISALHGSYGSVKFHPSEGDLIIFPCYQTHFSHPFFSERERILISSDIRVQDKLDYVAANSHIDLNIWTTPRKASE